jgi:hypothetical protein
MRLQLQERSLRKLRCQTWRLQTTWTWRTQSSNITRMMRLEPWVGSLYLHRFNMIYCLCNSNLWQLSDCDLYCNIVSSPLYIKMLFLGNVAYNQDDFWINLWLTSCRKDDWLWVTYVLTSTWWMNIQHSSSIHRISEGLH